MIDGVRLKFCGLTSLVDAEFADKLGADYLGFILYPKSPRHLALRDYLAMAPRLPTGRKRVAVMVGPSADELRATADAGFDYFQIHHRLEVGGDQLAAWSEQVGRDRIWLAPKLPPGTAMPAAVTAAARHVLVDTFNPDGFGGSGRTGDWSAFRRYREESPDTTWILAGGLGPANIGAALRSSGTRFIDVNSGVETAPGIKDHVKMKALVLAVHQARTASETAN